MRTIPFLLIIITASSFNLFSQYETFTGQYESVDQGFKREASISEDFFYIEIFVDGTDIKMFDSYQYLSRRANKVVRSKYPLDINREVTQLEIVELTSDRLVLKNLADNVEEVWKKVSNTVPDISPIKENAYFFNGALACAATENQSDSNACLNFNSIDFYMNRAQIEEILGEPNQTMQRDSQVYFIYLIQNQKEDQPYLVITYDNNKPTSLQLSGSKVGDDFAFSGIRLGDGGSYVRHRLGEPSRQSQISQEVIMWDYAPFPISIELKGGLVYSIRLEAY